MNKMIKRRKDDGFTLIELMIVIAVIGILAVVLVPKVGAIKTSAKQAGIDVNMRTVQGYCVSQIDKWSQDSATFDQAAVASEIDGVVTSGTNQMENPLDSTDPAFITSDDGDDAADAAINGVVFIQSAEVDAGTYTVVIAAIDSAGNVYKTTSITP